ncbi:MAG: cohesin domain-containing protein [Ruminococcus sp.]
MKHFFSTLAAAAMAAVLTVSASPSAFAESANADAVSDIKFSEGDNVEFKLYLSETKEDIIGFEMRLFYDANLLEFDKDSLEAEKFDSLFYNRDIEGKIPMNWTDIGNPASFSSKGEFISCKFKAKAAGEYVDTRDSEVDPTISYFVTEMYGDDMTYLKSYKFTYDLFINDKAVISDGVLPITKDADTLNSRQSSFINYADGMGEENSPNKDDHNSVVGEEHATRVVYEEDVIEATRYEEVASSSKNNNMIFLFIAIPVLGALVALAIVLVVKNKNKDTKSENSTENSNNFQN